MTNVRIALANVRIANSRDESVEIAEQAIAEAAAAGALVVAFPEAYVPGYRIFPRKVEAPDAAWMETAWTRIAAAAARARIGVLLGTERIANGKPLITVLVINPDGTRAGFQDKIQLDPSEDTTYWPGTERRAFTIGPLAFGVAICHEGWRYPETVRWAARRGAKVVFHPHLHIKEPGSYVPDEFGDPRNSFHEKAMLCRAAENTVYFASINCASEGSGTTSAIAKPDGTLLAWQPYGKEGLLVADLDLAAATGLLASRCKS
ncbi:MAG TPA: carbon-nitrogen hydrolase family protein [Gemmatimonadales bacterium]